MVWELALTHNSYYPIFTHTDIVGLYLSPPCNAVVISVDEKPAIQALERAQGYLKLPNGKAITDFIKLYNKDAAPFKWKKTRVKAVPLKHSIGDLRN